MLRQTLIALTLLTVLAPTQASTQYSTSTWYSLPGGAVGMQCASRDYPCGTTFMMWNANDRKAKHWLVKVTDMSPNSPFDLSPYAFRHIFGSTSKGRCKLARTLIHMGHCRKHRH